MRIALTGPAFAGKTSLARELRDEYGWDIINYTDTLKSLLAIGLSAVDKHLASVGVYNPDYNPTTVDDIVESKELYRPLIIALGDYLGFSDGFMVGHLLAAWEAHGLESLVVFDNVRFPAQMEALRPHGFVLVGLQISTREQERRAREAGLDEDGLAKLRAEPTEAGVVADIMLDANRPTGELAGILHTLAGFRAPIYASEYEYERTLSSVAN